MFNNEYRIKTIETPRQVIYRDFKVDLPIKGGWGYDIENPCIIDKNDPSVVQGMPFDGVGIEYFFVEKRIYEEMYILRPEEEKLVGRTWECERQILMSHQEKKIDRLIVNVTCVPKAIGDELLIRFEKVKHSKEEFEELEIYRKSATLFFTREYFFDISSFLK